ncbi:MAG: aldose epimerase family protein [Betaproteobacteria bacterium]
MPLPVRVPGVVLAMVALAGAAGPGARAHAGRVPPVRAGFGTMPDGTPIDVFTITNAHGIEIRAITYGGVITSIRTPDRAGRFDDIVLGFDRLEDYVQRSPYFGAIIGRYGNRIARGRFTLDGRAYTLATNDGPNHLHGGVKGFDKAVWRGEPFEKGGDAGVVFTHVSPGGDEGYPGRLSVKVTYTLTSADALVIEYEATTDAPTPVNLTNHSYFNLTGGARDILGHELTIDADRYTPIDATLIPTGELAPVAGTPFDFRKATPIGARINQTNSQLANGKGYDHNFVLNAAGPGLHHAAHVVEPTTGRTLDIATTEPGLQFYSGNFLDGTLKGTAGHVYGHRFGFCLETQHFPDSPNHANFPSTILRPGQTYHSKTVIAFGVAR